MLEPDPTKRITIFAVQKHPWMRPPLPAELNESWEQLQKEQATLTKRSASLQINQKLVAERNAAVWDLVQAAEKEGGNAAKEVGRGGATFIDRKPIPHGVRINMRSSAVLN